MLSTLLFASAAVASASLDRRFNFTTQDALNRINGHHLLDDACHPSWNYDTCNTRELQPPCGSEQGLSKRCEEGSKGFLDTATYEGRKAYRECLFGNESKYPAVLRGCVQCKVANGFYTKKGGDYLLEVLQTGNDIFKNNVSITGPLWNTVNKQGINWHLINNPNRNASAKRVAVKDYWTDPVYDLKVGRYTINGTTYGGDLDCENRETTPCPGDDMDEQVTQSAAVPESPVDAQDPIGHLENGIVFIQGEPKNATMYKMPKAFIQFYLKLTAFVYLNVPTTGVLDADSNQDIMSQVIDGKCDDCPAVASVNDIIAAGPSTPKSDGKAAELLMQSLPSNATGAAGPIDDAAKFKAIEIVLELYPKFQEPAIPKTVQTDKSKTHQASAKASCKRKRRAAFAQRPRV